MATTKHTSVDEGDCPLTSVRPLDPGVAQLIRQEVQAAINGVHESFSAPPSYSSSAPLLSSTIVAEDVDTEAQQPVTPPSMTLSDWGWLVLAMAPMFTWMLSWGVLSSLGVDPLDFAMLAFFLVLFPLSSLIFLGVTLFCLGVGGKSPEPAPLPLNPEEQKGARYASVAFSWGILGLYILFYGIIWLWAVMFEDRSVWHMYTVSRDLQAKITTEAVLSKLVACLHEAIPERNATIADFSACLKDMGMEETYTEFLPTSLVLD
ncbi:hypothetical protein BKA61DRAFT_659083 [Leptodontidium sp. MPI-SDFR-AT-0119]|nr:hypothetical protein BKA61DRAFT_659083 [Leptodontidium sp. MPI-SDFR-AT-0119]